MPPAIIGGVIAGAGAIGGAVIASNGAKSAANASAAAADRSSEVQQQIYGQNKTTLQPFVNTGTAAMGNINALLGIAPTQTAQPATSIAGGGYGGIGGVGGWPSVNGLAQPTGGTVNAAQPSQPTAQQAFDTYRNSTGYQFRVNQGLDAVNSGYAGAGTLQSGAALKAINDYGQGMASQEFGNYLNSLGNQQALGLSGASALAGVGQNYANSLGNIYQANGANQANAALAGASASAGAVNSLATIGAGMFGKKS